jgi:hypothetical protein
MQNSTGKGRLAKKEAMPRGGNIDPQHYVFLFLQDMSQSESNMTAMLSHIASVTR